MPHTHATRCLYGRVYRCTPAATRDIWTEGLGVPADRRPLLWFLTPRHSWFPCHCYGSCLPRVALTTLPLFPLPLPFLHQFHRHTHFLPHIPATRVHYLPATDMSRRTDTTPAPPLPLPPVQFLPAWFSPHSATSSVLLPYPPSASCAGWPPAGSRTVPTFLPFTPLPSHSQDPHPTPPTLYPPHIVGCGLFWLVLVRCITRFCYYPYVTCYCCGRQFTLPPFLAHCLLRCTMPTYACLPVRLPRCWHELGYFGLPLVSNLPCPYRLPAFTV